MKRTISIAAVAIAVSMPAASQPQQRLGVAAFFPVKRCDGVFNPDWDRIQNASNAVKLVVSDKTTLCDPVNIADTRTKFNALRVQPVPGQLVLGYVDTNNGRRLLTYVFNGGDPIPPPNPTSVGDWYRDYGGYIDGIFFDNGPSTEPGMPSEADLRTYYTSLFQQMRSYSGTCGPNRNQGCVMVNASQYPNNWVLAVADYVTLWERALHGAQMCARPDGQDYLTNFIPTSAQQNPSGWYFDNLNASRAEHIIYSATQSDVLNIVCQSRAYGTPMLYINDLACANYGRLSSLFEQTISITNPGCPNPFTLSCGQDPTDACGTIIGGCGQGLWCPPGMYCNCQAQYCQCL